MIDHLLSDDKTTALSDNNTTDIVCISDACASNEDSIGVCEETDESTEEITQSNATTTIDILPKTYPIAGNSPSLRRIECRLEGRELWSKFYELSTEMIITKSGRYVEILPSYN
uniref:T-box domain-containing protein n=1 Tax=Parascaris equorum TaxID=6256 RepID=A0A914S975_PAREQ